MSSAYEKCWRAKAFSLEAASDAGVSRSGFTLLCPMRLLRIGLLGLALGASACQEPSPVVPLRDSASSEASVSNDTGTTQDTVEPLYTAEELKRVLEDLGTLGLPNARALRDSYQELMLHGDDDCPGSAVDIQNAPDGCESSEGWFYLGSVAYSETETIDEEGNQADTFETFPCDILISSPEGVSMVAGGTIKSERLVNSNGQLSAKSMVDGTWIYPDSDFPWLAQGFSAELTFWMEGYSAGEVLLLQGTFGTPGTYIFLDRLSWGKDEACEDRVESGTVWIRQADGTWYELVWAEDCSGCFRATWNLQQDLGEACPDLSELKATVVEELWIEP